MEAFHLSAFVARQLFTVVLFSCDVFKASVGVFSKLSEKSRCRKVICFKKQCEEVFNKLPNTNFQNCSYSVRM
jgi:hypothetical protein